MKRKVIRGVCNIMIIFLLSYLLFAVWIGFSAKSTMDYILEGNPFIIEKVSNELLYRQLNFSNSKHYYNRFPFNANEKIEMSIFPVIHIFHRAYVRIIYSHSFDGTNAEGITVHPRTSNASIFLTMELQNGKWTITDADTSGKSNKVKWKTIKQVLFPSSENDKK